MLGFGCAHRSSMYYDSAGVCNPKGWQMVAGGRSLRRPPVRGRENSGHAGRDARTLRPLQGRFGIRDRRAGGITSLTSLNHRLLSGKPSACRTADPKTNPITPLDAASALYLHSGDRRRGAPVRPFVRPERGDSRQASCAFRPAHGP